LLTFAEDSFYMDISTFDAISPIDGRYRKTCEVLSDYFSEASLIRYRIKTEAAYFIALTQIPLPQLQQVPRSTIEAFKSLVNDTSSVDIYSIKEIEAITNHDVKAVEYYLKKVYNTELGAAAEFIHFGLTSQDINNTAIPMLIRDAVNNIIKPAIGELRLLLSSLAEEWRNIPMLAHTHGQPASPTALGKEIAVFIERLDIQTSMLNQTSWSGKFGGATGNFNAHYAAFPAIDWEAFADNLLDELGLVRSKNTTQIEHYDNLAALFDNLKRINTILIDLSRDTWSYISMNYFTQLVKKGEVGSSAMPHKVNPIDFENAEGNLGMANAIFQHLAEKLPISRLQRDLTDSTVLRNAGVPFAHTLIALKSLIKGFNKIKVNEAAIADDLNNNWAVVAEAIQTILRREGYPNPYEALKDLTRTGEKINEKVIDQFISSLKVEEKIKEELRQISPSSYTGNAFRFKTGNN
jgi:adenylosuccinate lyase